MVLPRVDGRITVDGRVDEPAWAAIPALALTNLYPRFASPLTEQTEIRIAYDAEYLYGSIRAYDRDPRRILATTFYRDRWSGDDEFVVILDTFDDNENAMMFLVTPNGVRVDNLLYHDTEPGNGEWINQDWNTVWDAAATRTADGWFAELRIPFSSLRYRAQEGKVRMRLKTYRYIRRRNENQMFPATRPEAGANPHFKPSVGQPILLRDIGNHRAHYLTPSLTTGLAQHRNRALPGAPRRTETTMEPGLDFKAPLGAGLTLDVTTNTDFAQVEADDQRINLTRFSLFFPEKRPFFQERSGLFAFSTGGETALFYSRRIGLDSEGRPVRLLAGARVSGRTGPWDLGLLTVQTGATAERGTENVGVLRLRRGILGTGSSAGVMLTHRVTGDGRLELAGGADATLRTGTHTAIITVATSANDTSAGGLAATLARARIQRQRGEGLSYAGEVRWAGRRYDPGLGFVQARDAREGTARASYAWRPQSGPLRRIGTIAAGEGRWRNRDGAAELVTGFLDLNAETHGNMAGGITLRRTHEDLPVPLPLEGGVVVPAGRYRFTAVTLGAGSPEDRRLRGNATATIGGFFGGRRVSAAAELVWAPSPHLEVGSRVDHTTLRFPARAERAHTTVSQVRLRIAANTRLFLDTFLQHHSARRTLLLNGRVRYNFREGHDLWLVYDELREGGTAADAWVPSARALLVKYAHALTL